MLHWKLQMRSHLFQPQQILLFGNACWTVFACTVAMGPYLHVSCQETSSHPDLDNELAEQTASLTVLEQRLYGKDRMDQRDCCAGSTRERPSQIKGTRTRHHERPFGDREDAVGERGRREKGRWIELWALLDVSACKGWS